MLTYFETMVAEALASGKPPGNTQGPDQQDHLTAAWDASAMLQWLGDVRAVAAKLRGERDGFEHDRFLALCGVD